MKIKLTFLLLIVSLSCTQNASNNGESQSAKTSYKQWYDWLITDSTQINDSNGRWRARTYGIFADHRDCLCYPSFTHLTVYTNGKHSIMYTRLSTWDNNNIVVVAMDSPDWFSIIKLTVLYDTSPSGLQSVADTINNIKPWNRNHPKTQPNDLEWAATFKKEYDNGVLKLIDKNDPSVKLETNLYDIYCQAEELEGRKPKALNDVEQQLFNELPPFVILTYEQFAHYFIPEDSLSSVSRIEDLSEKRIVFGL